MDTGDEMGICPAGCRGLPESFPINGMCVLDVAYSVPTRVVRALYVVAGRSALRGQIRSGTFAYSGTTTDLANDWGARYYDSPLWIRLNQLRVEDTVFERKMTNEEFDDFLASTRLWYRRRHSDCRRGRGRGRRRPSGPRRVVREVFTEADLQRIVHTVLTDRDLPPPLTPISSPEPDNSHLVTEE